MCKELKLDIMITSQNIVEGKKLQVLNKIPVEKYKTKMKN